MKAVMKMLRTLLGGRQTEIQAEEARKSDERDRVGDVLAARQHELAARVHVLEWETGLRRKRRENGTDDTPVRP